MVRTLLSLAAVALLVATQPQLADAAQKQAGTRSSAKAAVTGAIDINTAPASELERLPGIGAKAAARIVEYRQKNGRFKKIEELMNVLGIGEKNFLKIKGQVTVTAPKGERSAAPQH